MIWLKGFRVFDQFFNILMIKRLAVSYGNKTGPSNNPVNITLNNLLVKSSELINVIIIYFWYIIIWDGKMYF